MTLKVEFLQFLKGQKKLEEVSIQNQKLSHELLGNYQKVPGSAKFNTSPDTLIHRGDPSMQGSKNQKSQIFFVPNPIFSA